MTDNYPEPTGGFPSITELVGQTVDVAEVFTTRDGTPAIVSTTGKIYLCDNAWASAGATFIEGKLNSSQSDYTRERVVEEQGLAGFRPVEA